MTQEVLEAGRPAPRRRRSGMPAGLVWTLGIITLIVLTVASLAVISDLTARTVEDEMLISAIEKSESAMKATQDEFAAVLDKYDTQDLSDADRAELLDRLGEVASDGQFAIAEAGLQVADVPILPWHDKIRAAQDAYLEHNRAWVNYLGAAAEDPAEWFQPQPDVNNTFAAAKAPLVAAIPLLDVTELLPRVRAIFDDGGESDGGSTNGGGQAA
ncbi:MAG: hypothetical protein VW082_12515 [Candidatus Nanopelagicales bacterium]